MPEDVAPGAPLINLESIDKFLINAEESATKFESAFGKDEPEGSHRNKRLFHGLLHAFAGLTHTNVSYYRQVNVGQKTEYLEWMMGASGQPFEINEDQLDMIAVLAREAKIDNNSIIGHMACSPEKRKQFEDVSVERVSDTIEMLYLYDIEILAKQLRGPTEELGHAGYYIGTMLIFSFRIPGDPIGRLFQFMRQKDVATDTLRVFQEKEISFILFCCRYLVYLIKNLEETTGVSSVDMLKTKAALQTSEINRLKDELAKSQDSLNRAAQMIQSLGQSAIQTSRLIQNLNPIVE